MKKTADILFETCGRAGVITLNRPKALNAVTDDMVIALDQQLDLWEKDEAVERVLIKAVEGRAFSAGGDIRHLYERGMAHQYDFGFFEREYRLNARIARFPKPYIALINGLVMGGGVGLSFHGSHRIVGEGLEFAMPEVGIGFFPDVGASYLLSRLPGQLGVYLGLTGARVRQADALWSGLASHACQAVRFQELEKALCEEKSLPRVLDEFSLPLDDLEAVRASKGDNLRQLKPVIDDLFAGFNVITHQKRLMQTLSQLQSLSHKDEASLWAKKTYDVLSAKSPTSLTIAARQIEKGSTLSMDECMQMEYRILKRVLIGPEFYEGIRAVIIDKDNKPVWQPDDLAKVDPAFIASHFDNLGSQELKLYV